MDVRKTVDELAAMEIRVHYLALGCVDLTSSEGRMTMQVIAAVAEFEKDLIIERSQAGLALSPCGRKEKTDADPCSPTNQKTKSGQGLLRGIAP